tara:strand:+ start:693 stop:914 length:222 start_codon:yes stop_codon:yes gene_type:complete
MRVKLEPDTAFIGKKFAYIFIAVIFGLNLITFFWFFFVFKFKLNRFLNIGTIKKFIKIKIFLRSLINKNLESL